MQIITSFLYPLELERNRNGGGATANASPPTLYYSMTAGSRKGSCKLKCGMINNINIIYIYISYRNVLQYIRTVRMIRT